MSWYATRADMASRQSFTNSPTPSMHLEKETLWDFSITLSAVCVSKRVALKHDSQATRSIQLRNQAGVVTIAVWGGRTHFRSCPVPLKVKTCDPKGRNKPCHSETILVRCSSLVPPTKPASRLDWSTHLSFLLVYRATGTFLATNQPFLGHI